MASEIQLSFASGKTVYFLVRGESFNIGLIWNGTTFTSYVSANFSQYPVTMSEQGTSGFYAGNFPATIAAGSYSIVAKQQITGTPQETDPTIATGTFDWNGTYPAPLSDVTTSGQLGQGMPIRLARGTMIQNFPFKLVSATDHTTAFTSGSVTGQISRDGGAFGALQSGAFTEIGLGYYKLQALTSGDLLANTAALTISATNTGGSSDSRDFVFVLQRTSGQ